MLFMEELKQNTKLKFNYVNAVLQAKEEYIQNEYNQILLSGGKV